ncbi:MAG: superinfection immunity protein, partial [Polynucleobacter sp.]|nr:superinfection immunity protein [Polynucleobacter sp.]
MRFLFALLITILSIFYFLPFAIAFYKKRINTGAIFALNLFLGWSLIGWVIALVW